MIVMILSSNEIKRVKKTNNSNKFLSTDGKFYSDKEFIEFKKKFSLLEKFLILFSLKKSVLQKKITKNLLKENEFNQKLSVLFEDKSFITEQWKKFNNLSN